MMRSRNWLVAVATFGIVIAGLGWSATPTSAAGTSTGSIYTSVNPAHAGQDVTFNVVVEGNFQSPVGLVQLFDGFSLLGPATSTQAANAEPSTKSLNPRLVSTFS
jgi:hypothetical protein